MSIPAASATEPAEILSSLHRLGLIPEDEEPQTVALTGGVASDIWRIDLASGPICVKRALEKLKVAADWHVPVDRNANEVAWMQTAGAIVPGCVPSILAHDLDAGLFAMEFFQPATHPNWKEELRAGRAEPDFAFQVGHALGQIHAGTAGDPKIKKRFASDDIFHAIRLEPYLEATANRHPALADILKGLSRTTARNRRVLVHGDISPKNILAGPEGPVFLDAECAWYGDPAFDLAFCLKHFLLKCLWVPDFATDYLICFQAMCEAYLAKVSWEPMDQFQSRVVRLLPGLFLGRVDGKSPVEYLQEFDKTLVRRVATDWLTVPRNQLNDIRADWSIEIANYRQQN